MASHRHFLRLLDDPFFPFPPPPPSSSSCPFLLDLDHPSPFPTASPFPDLDDLLLPPAPALDPFFAFPPTPSPYTPLLLRDLTDRVAALELAIATARRRPEPPATRKRTYVTEAGGRKVKWTSVEKPRAGERTLRWEAEIKSPDDDGFDRKWKWEAKGGSSAAGGAGARKLKWGAAVKGKGCLEPWSQAYTWEEDFTASDSDDEEEERAADKNKNKTKKATVKKEKKEEVKAVKKEKKCPFATVKIEEISDDNDAGCVAIKKVRPFLLHSSFSLTGDWVGFCSSQGFWMVVGAKKGLLFIYLF